MASFLNPHLLSYNNHSPTRERVAGPGDPDYLCTHLHVHVHVGMLIQESVCESRGWHQVLSQFLVHWFFFPDALLLNLKLAWDWLAGRALGSTWGIGIRLCGCWGCNSCPCGCTANTQLTEPSKAFKTKPGTGFCHIKVHEPKILPKEPSPPSTRV